MRRPFLLWGQKQNNPKQGYNLSKYGIQVKNVRETGIIRQKYSK